MGYRKEVRSIITRRRLLVIGAVVGFVPAFLRRAEPVAAVAEPEAEHVFEVMYASEHGVEEWTLTPAEAYRLADEREASDPVFAESLRNSARD
jgi:hypothetical protein